MLISVHTDLLSFSFVLLLIGIFASLDKIEHFQFNEAESCSSDNSEKTCSKSVKMVKNFNEFLNFAPINKSGISPKPLAAKSAVTNDSSAKPSIKLTKSSFDDSDSSSIAECSNNTTDKDSGNGNSQATETPATTKPAMQLHFVDKKQMSVDGSSPDDSQEYFPMTTSMTRELRLELENLNRHVFGNNFNAQFTSKPSIEVEEIIGDGAEDCDTPESNESLVSSKSPANFSEISYIKLHQNSTDGQEDDQQQQADKIYRYPSDRNLNGVIRNRVHTSAQYDENTAMKRISTASANADVFVWKNPLHQISPTTTVYADIENEEKIPLCNNGSSASTPDEQIELEYDGEIVDESSFGKKSVTPIRLLRKNGEDGIGSALNRSNGSSKRSSRIYRNDSDSESSAENSCNDNHNHLVRKSQSQTLTELQTSATLATDKGSITSSPIDEEASEANIMLRKLPPPTEFGGGNPFLMFLCLTLLLQHRNYVIKNNMDYNEMAMHFDKMVRKHNVIRVLNQARRMYAEYLKSQHVYNTVGAIKPTTKNHHNNNIKQKSDVRT